MATGKAAPTSYAAGARKIVKVLANGSYLVLGPDGLKIVKPVPDPDGGWPIIGKELRRLAESQKSESVGRIIGSLADGGYFILGPHGGHVGPWNPDQIREAEEAVASLARSVRTLQNLGLCPGNFTMG